MLEDHVRGSINPTIDIDPNSILYTHPVTGALFSTLKGALDYLYAVNYPNYIGRYADIASLPASADANDLAMVDDDSPASDGTGGQAGFVWIAIDGPGAWKKKYDVDWSIDNVLSQLLGQTDALYAFLGGQAGGQELVGGTATTENLTLNANSFDSTGSIIFKDNLRPDGDNDTDLGTLTKRLRDIFVLGALKDGTVSLTLAQLKTAFDHISLTNNPHAVDYDQLALKLGTLTVTGDVSGTVDLSSSGNKGLALTVSDDSHNHTKATLPDFDLDVWTQVKAYFKDNDGITYAFNDGLKTITPSQADIDTSEITDINAPVADKVMVGNAAGDTWVPSDGTVELTGEVSGSGSYNSTTDKTSFAVTVDNVDISKITGINLLNFAGTIAVGNPANINHASHGLISGMSVRVINTTSVPTSLGVHTVTVVDGDNFTIPFNVTGAGTVSYIPSNAQLLYDTATNKFIIRREYEEITHFELSGLTADDHTQYVMKDGRVGGQTVKGGTASSDDLYLESTNDATKGNVVTKDNLVPNDTAVYSAGWTGVDLGNSAKKFNDLHSAGEYFGFRFENVTATPTASAQKIGHAVVNTTTGFLELCVDGVSYLTIGQVDLSTLQADIATNATDITTLQTEHDYFGGLSTTDGTWRLEEVGGDLYVQKRIAGTYVNKFVFEA